MAVRIRLLRMGKIRNPQYRIVVADARTKRDGRAIEFIGLYHPKEEPSRIEVNSERVQHWLSVGAQPSEPVVAILSRTGDWQKFKGLPPPAEPLKVAPARADRRAAFEVEAKAAAGLVEADKAKKKAARPAKAESEAAAKADSTRAPAQAAAKPDATPAATEPTATEPTSAEPTAAEPTASEPTASEPTAAEPTAALPTTAEPPPAAEPTPEPAAEPPASQESTSAGADPQA